MAGFGAIHQQAAQVLAENTFLRLDNVAQVIGRRSEDMYRTLALENIRGSVVGFETWKQVARNFREDLAQRGVTGFRDTKNREWNMRSYSEMVARTSTMEAHLQGTANRLLEHGHDLVKVSSHAGACEMCQPYQGRVLSLTGKTEGYPTLEEARADGLFHPRCRHAYSLHIDLDKEIEEIEKETERQPLEYPKDIGARVNPDIIRDKYPAEQILETIRNSDWASRREFTQEHQKHGRDWMKDTGMELTLKQFDELQSLVMQHPGTGVFYYVHRKVGAQIALYLERATYLDKVFRKIGLVYSIDRNLHVGFWRIKGGQDYFKSQNDFVEIRSPKTGD